MKRRRTCNREARSSRRALGALFLFLAAALAGIAFAAAWGAGSSVGRWVVAVAAGAIALWMASLVARALR